MKVYPTRSSQCGAKTRAGHPCKSHPVTGRRRCRMHDGAAATGAPRGNRNGLRHGYYTAEARLLRRQARQLLREITAERSTQSA